MPATVHVQTRLALDLAKRLDQRAADANVTRAELLRDMLESALDATEAGIIRRPIRSSPDRRRAGRTDRKGRCVPCRCPPSPRRRQARRVDAALGGQAAGLYRQAHPSGASVSRATDQSVAAMPSKPTASIRPLSCCGYGSC